MSVTYEFHHLFEEDNITTSEQNDRWESCEARYVVYTSEPVEEPELWEAIRASDDIPKTMMNCVMTNISNFEHCNRLLWKFTVQYDWSYAHSSSDGIDTDREIISYDFGSQTMNAKLCLDIVHTYGNCPDHGYLVNVQDGETQGLEIYTPYSTMTIQKYFRKTHFNSVIRDKIIYRVTRVNDATFKGFPSGEVLFLGASISDMQENNKYVSINFNFLLSPNETGMNLGPYTSNVDKEGHQAIWPHVRKDDKNNRVIDGIYVGKFYKKADFTEMGLSAHV